MCVEKASKNTMQNVIKISNEESVSSDFIGDSHSCIFDEDSSIQLNPNFFKIICWYENEYSYATRVADSIFFCEKQNFLMEISSKMSYVTSRYLRKQDETQQTECYKKEMSVSCCEYNSDFSSELTCNTSQKIESKSPSRQFVKTLLMGTTSLPSDTKTKNELVKIWNKTSEITKPIINKNTCSFYQSSETIATPNPAQAEGIHPRTRLENVRREFSKMVNITEDLLKKTKSNQSDVHSIPKNGFINKSDVQFRTKETYFIAETESHKKTEQNIAMDNCGDCKSLTPSSKNMIQVLNNDSNEVEVSSHLYEKDISGCALIDNKVLGNQDSIQVTRSTNILKPPSLSKEDKIKTKETVGKNTAGLGKIHHDNFKEQLAKTVNGLIDGLPQNDKVQYFINGPKIEPAAIDKLEIRNKRIEENFNDSVSSVTTVSQKSICDKNVNEITTVEQSLIEPTLNSKHKITLFEKYNDNTNVKLIDEKLRKRNIVLVDNPFVSETLSDENISNDLTVENAKPKINMNLARQILGRINLDPETVVVVSEDNSRCDISENNNITISNRIENKQDLYDKLDSVSATDSNNSFEVSKRNSQVIHITDLTNSFEDLVRLDKICRIIEISDELSDKLFSALDNTDGNIEKNQRWSFRDLCERIHLDEFCNRVFGKSAL